MTQSQSKVLNSLSEIEPVEEFKKLSRKVSSTSVGKNRVSRKNSVETYSPREEIYKSMIREIKTAEVAPMSSLVHKASGILRLTHFNKAMKNRKYSVSWDIDGRKVINYEDGRSSKVQLHRESPMEPKKTFLSTLKEPIFGLNGLDVDFSVMEEKASTAESKAQLHRHLGGTDGEPRVSKAWEEYIDLGVASKLRDNMEAIIPHTENKSPLFFGTATESNSSSASQSPSQTRPPWKNFSKVSKLILTPPVSRTSSSLSIEENSAFSCGRSHLSTLKNEKVERVQNICVVNGRVVSVKNFDSKNFRNWFGDESALDDNQQRSQPKFHVEMDMMDVESKDIQIRLLDGYKLEVEGRRRLEGSRQFLRIKEVIMIPEGFQAEGLLLCRTTGGKLVIENLTVEPARLKDKCEKGKSKKKRNVSSKSK